MKLKKKILLIDDEESFTSMLRINLESTDRYDIKVINDPEEAIVRALQYKPDIIILDVIMPKMDGSDVAAKLRTVKDLQNVPIIFLTAMVSRYESEEMHKDKERQIYVPKPCNIQRLINILEERLTARC